MLITVTEAKLTVTKNYSGLALRYFLSLNYKNSWIIFKGFDF